VQRLILCGKTHPESVHHQNSCLEFWNSVYFVCAVILLQYYWKKKLLPVLFLKKEIPFLMWSFHSILTYTKQAFFLFFFTLLWCAITGVIDWISFSCKTDVGRALLLMVWSWGLERGEVESLGLGGEGRDGVTVSSLWRGEESRIS